MTRDGDTEATGLGRLPSLNLTEATGPDSSEIGEATTAVQTFAKVSGLDAGTVIDGKYTIESVLGVGGMGLVFAAEHRALRERVALKFLVSDQEGFDFRARFRREAQICAKIRNEHIVKVIDVGSWQGAAFMVMEHLSGSDLGTLLEKSGPVSLSDAVEYVVQVCSGLAEVHAHGIVHRDLKPSNLFITRRADGSPLVKILDFGISKWRNEESSGQGLTKVGTVLGTPEYMAPEQLFGSNSVDHRADIWSIGVILYELLTGTTPYTETTFAKLCAEFGKGLPPRPPRSHRNNIPVELDAAVMLCLQPDLEKRIPNVAVLAGELLAAVGSSNADSQRMRLEAALDSASNPQTPRSKGSRTGEYVAQSLRESSQVPLTDPTRELLQKAQTIAADLERAPAAPPVQPTRSKSPLGVVAIAAGVALLGVGAYFVHRTTAKPDPDARALSRPHPSTAAVAASAPIVETAAPVPGVAAEPLVSATADMAAAPSATAGASTGAPGASTSPTGGKRSTRKTSAPATSASTASSAPQVVAPPPATTTPPNPSRALEDRQ